MRHCLGIWATELQIPRIEPEHLYVVARAFELVRDHAHYLEVRFRLEKTQGSIIKAILLAELPP